MNYSSDCYKFENLIIRRSTMEDIERFSKIESDCFSKKYCYGSSLLTVLVNTALNHTIFSAEINNMVVGFIIAEIDNENPKLGRVVSIQVDPAFQRNSIGQKLLTKIENSLYVNYGIEIIQLQVHYNNKKAILFYRSHGYIIQKELRNYYERKEHAYLMQKELGTKKRNLTQ